MPKVNDLSWLKNLEAQNDDQRPSGKKLCNVLGVDFGEKFCGLAFSPDGICIVPLKVVPSGKLEEVMREVLKEKKIQSIVFGLPFLPDGSENRLCPKIKSFAQKFSKEAKIEFVNERFSSKTVRGQKDERIDDLAAIRILEFAFAKK